MEIINYNDFAKLEIRIGQIVSCEPIPHSEKLLKLQVDFGEFGQKQILTGMQKWFKPSDFENKKGLFVVNLETRMMAGEKSEGMFLSGGENMNETPKLVFVDNSLTNGIRII